MDCTDVCHSKKSPKSGGDITATWSKCGHTEWGEYLIESLHVLLELFISPSLVHHSLGHIFCALHSLTWHVKCKTIILCTLFVYCCMYCVNNHKFSTHFRVYVVYKVEFTICCNSMSFHGCLPFSIHHRMVWLLSWLLYIMAHPQSWKCYSKPNQMWTLPTIKRYTE